MKKYKNIAVDGDTHRAAKLAACELGITLAEFVKRAIIAAIYEARRLETEDEKATA